MAADTPMDKQAGIGAGSERARDRALICRIAEGDRSALEQLYRRYQPRLFQFLYRLTRSYGTADELVNDIMLAVWQSAGNFRGDSQLSTWIFGIAYRKALRRLERRQRRLQSSRAAENIATDEGPAHETEDWVWHGIESLPPDQRIAVLLVFYLGLSYPEVAEVTGCPVNTVKSRMFHARRKLRARLEQSATGDRRAGWKNHE